MLERSTVESGLKSIKMTLNNMMLSKYTLIASGSISEEEVNKIITETIDECVAKYSGKSMRELTVYMLEEMMESVIGGIKDGKEI